MKHVPIMGLDISPSATGIAVMAGRQIETTHVGRHLTKEEWISPVHVAQAQRAVVDEIQRWIGKFGVRVVAIEGHSFSSRPNNYLVEFVGALKWALWFDSKTPKSLKDIRIVAPLTARKTLDPSLTRRRMKKERKEKSAKDVVREYLAAKGVTFPDDNEMDAWVILNWLNIQVNKRPILGRR